MNIRNQLNIARDNIFVRMLVYLRQLYSERCRIGIDLKGQISSTVVWV